MRCRGQVKSSFDDEAVVLGYEPGKGKHEGRCGALALRNRTGVKFKVGA